MADQVVPLISFAILLACLPVFSSSAAPLKFLLMVASDSSPDSSAIVPAVNQTLEEINRNTSILPEHHLDYILSNTSQVLFNYSTRETTVVLFAINKYMYAWYTVCLTHYIQCNQEEALNDFFDVATDSTVVAIVGCGCSAVTEVIAKISSHFNLSVVSSIG